MVFGAPPGVLGPAYELRSGPGEDGGVCGVTAWEGAISLDSIHPLGQTNTRPSHKTHSGKGDCRQQTSEPLFLCLEENPLTACDIEVLMAV
jgi:hypothetical protein